MPKGSAQVVADRIVATGATCEFSRPTALADAILSAATPPTVATAVEPLPACLADTDVVIDPTGAELQAARTGVTRAMAAVKASGSLAITGFSEGNGLLSVFVEKHIAVIRESEIVADVGEVLTRSWGTGDDRESVILATGPSATADMGTLVTGAHGPREVHVIIIEGE